LTFYSFILRLAAAKIVEMKGCDSFLLFFRFYFYCAEASPSNSVSIWLDSFEIFHLFLKSKQNQQVQTETVMLTFKNCFLVGFRLSSDDENCLK
jgi:hypothetical protein